MSVHQMSVNQMSFQQISVHQMSVHQMSVNQMSVNQTEAGLLNQSSCLARALGITKFIIVKDMILVTLCCAT